MADGAAPAARKGAIHFNRRLAWLLLSLSAVAALAIVVAPVWIIHPFKRQSDSGLALAYAMRRWSPLATLVSLAFVAGLTVLLWRGSRRLWPKAAMVVACLLVGMAAWFARQNHFEWLFNPLPSASFASTSEASFISDSDKVIAIELNGDPAAYPVRQMAYHHIVQDVVGGTPVVVTY